MTLAHVPFEVCARASETFKRTLGKRTAALPHRTTVSPFVGDYKREECSHGHSSRSCHLFIQKPDRATLAGNLGCLKLADEGGNELNQRFNDLITKLWVQF